LHPLESAAFHGARAKRTTFAHDEPSRSQINIDTTAKENRPHDRSYGRLASPSRSALWRF
jgi:hypothetical protein